MTTALFYENPRPLDAARDANLKVREIVDLSFARKVNTIPINLSEFSAVARHYPIGFIGEGAAPMAIVGLQRENLFLDDQGRWKPGVYVPAFVRRYPFIFANTDSKTEFTLCVDDVPAAVATDEGRPLFENGQLSDTTTKAMDFCRSFHQAATQTDAFAKAMRTSGLLANRQAETRLSGGPSFTLSGFKVIDQDKLRRVPSRTLGSWNDKNWLAPLYAHIQSMTNWNDLMALIPPGEAPK